MKLSVIVPAYNSEKTIERCLNSIIKQDISSFEIIVVNDGSKDNTVNVINEIKTRYSDSIIRVINKVNAGLPQARKTGLECAKGEYIGFVDSDDWIERNMYSLMLEKAESNKLDVVACDMSFDYLKSSDIHRNSIKKNMSSDDALLAINYRYGIFGSMCNKIFKKSVFDEIVFPKGNFVGEDYTVVTQIFRKKKDLRVGVVNIPGYHYIINSSSMVYNKYGKPQELAYYNYKRILMNVHRVENQKYINSFESYMVNEFMGIILFMGADKKYDIEKIKWIQRYIRKRIIKIIASRYNTLLCKLTSIVMCFSPRTVVYIYEFYRKKIKLMNY